MNFDQTPKTLASQNLFGVGNVLWCTKITEFTVIDHINGIMLDSEASCLVEAVSIAHMSA